MLTKFEEILNKLTKSERTYLLDVLNITNDSYDLDILTKISDHTICIYDTASEAYREKLELVTSKRNHKERCLEYTVTPEGWGIARNYQKILTRYNIGTVDP